MLCGRCGMYSTSLWFEPGEAQKCIDYENSCLPNKAQRGVRIIKKIIKTVGP